MKLFMFYVGGDCGSSNMELHDVRFSISHTTEDCHADLRKQWWGDPLSLHLDCWGEVRQADGHDLGLEPGNAPDDGPKLFFCNLGGYDPAIFAELHENVLLVAPDPKAATARALQKIAEWTQPHKDKVFEVEKAIDLSALVGEYGYHLRLTAAAEAKKFVFGCGYVPIGRA